MLELSSVGNLDTMQFVVLTGVFIVGTVVSFVNAIAGGGSTLSLPFFLFLGFPSAIAHGTNRMGLLAGAGSAAWSMYRKNHVPHKLLLKILPSVLLGTLLGTLVTVEIPGYILNPLVGVAIIVVTYVAITEKNKNGNKKNKTAQTIQKEWKKYFLLFLVGFYGGFLQVGMGLVMMGVFSRILNKEGSVEPLSMYEINGLKVSVGFVLLVTSLCIMIPKNLIAWEWAVVYGLGSMLGGWIGVRWQLTASLKYVKGFVSFVGFALGAWLLLSSLLLVH